MSTDPTTPPDPPGATARLPAAGGDVPRPASSDADDRDATLTGVVVAVDPAAGITVQDVVVGLQAAGMVVDRTMEALGTVAGRVAPDHLDLVRRVPGVSAVEPDTEFRLPPPGSGIQ